MQTKHPDQLAAQRWCSDQIRNDLKAGRSMSEFPIHDIESKARVDMNKKNTNGDLLCGGGNIFQIYYHDKPVVVQMRPLASRTLKLFFN